MTPTKKHKLAGQQMTGAEMILQVLADEGVDTIFGYSGGAILPTYDAIFRYNANKPTNEQIRLIVPANEQGAGFMAAGYARASGKVGCFMVTSGPGATNCVTPIRDSMADSVPVVLICGQVARASIGSDAFQEAPVFNIMSACAKHVFLVKDPEKLEATVRTAFEIARSGRPGPVVIDVPKDVQNWTGIFQGSGMLHFHGYEKRLAALRASRITKSEAASFFKLLAKSDRPLIYAGGGVITSNAAAQLRSFSKRFRIPVVTTLMGIGSIDTRDELALHMLGMHGTAYANYAVEDCDFLIAVGARFDDRVAGKVSEFAPNCQAIAHIDIDAAEIGKVKPAQWAHVGDARTALEDLLAYGEGFKKDFSRWVKHVLELKAKHRMNYNRKSDLLEPYYVIECLNEITQGEAIVCTGVGQHQMWAAQYFDFKHPRTWITSGSMGTMGFGLPASVGAKIAKPDHIVIDVDGDGSLRMNLGELETVTTYQVPVKILLLNNLGDGMVRQWQTLYFGERFSGSDKSLHKKDFVKAAEADGFQFAKRLRDKAHVKKTLEEFIAFDGPAFLECLINPNAHVYPMVGPGMGYKEMVTGDYIVPRKIEQEKTEHEEVDMTKIPDLF
ncbi:MAG TPA: biosynthetic-type acetolactate synthase large subunit [Candidatus Hydrogenedentes bacterium]|nr:biosynthetic-type acetolactate synthase large subunit [Candidatus Hydrogenedentota bacterium]HOL78165.1 biosynthetic-type acetolactate synthase large subunit [Candidatus Hydrogenedentota bacterium]HPO87252.1 biosynthetic-type acetolactate synthase large subunit [Candidatus Hydrogenedentota bacterium]